MLGENLTAERTAIEVYRHFLALLGDHDPVTRRLLASILATEEAQADDLLALLAGLAPDPAVPRQP